MATLTVFINGREYKVACDSGQEDHLQRLAAEIDDRTRQIAMQMGATSEGICLVLAALMMADEMHDIRRELSQLREEIRHTSQSFEQNKRIEMENAVAQIVEDIAGRIEKIADRLEAN